MGAFSACGQNSDRSHTCVFLFSTWRVPQLISKIFQKIGRMHKAFQFLGILGSVSSFKCQMGLQKPNGPESWQGDGSSKDSGRFRWWSRACRESYSTPDLVPDRTEELNARPFAEKKVSCLKQSFSIFHYLCSGISVFVQRRNLGTTGAEQPSPCLRSPKVGELLTLSPVWALDFPAQLISYLSIRKKSYFCRRVHYKQPPQQPRIMSDTSFEILP